MVPLFFEYAAWHYSRALTDYMRVWSNVMWFLFNFFSVPLLLKTLFAPFHRLDEHYRKGFYPSDWANTFILNMLMRVVGAFVRLMIILMGLTTLALACVAGVVVFAVWLLAPVFVAGLVVTGLTYLAL